jgi:hypothetical protein
VGEQGTPHIQGAIVFNNSMRRKAFKAAIGYDGYCEKMRGAWEDQSYCFKEGVYNPIPS